MIPLLFAASLTLSPAVAQPVQAYDPNFAAPQKAPNIRTLGPDPTAACARLTTQTVAPDGIPLRKLGDLPGAIMEHAVWRTVAGCPVREIVYEGQTYYVDGPIPRVVDDLRASRIARRKY